MTIIDVSENIRLSLALPLPRVSVYTGSSLPIGIKGIPDAFAGNSVTAVSLTLTNADGASVTADCECSNGIWCSLFASSNFTTYGFISRGVKIVATVVDGDTTHAITVGVGDLDVMADSAGALPGDPGAHYQTKGGDMFFKSEIVNGVQHYKRVTIGYNARLGAWSYNDPEGDYILASNGDFIAAT